MDKAAKIIVIIVVIASSGYFIFSKIAGWHEDQLNTAIEQQQLISQQNAEALEQKIAELEEELTIVKGQKVPEEKLAEVFGSDKESMVPDAHDETPAEVVREVRKLATMVGNDQELATVLSDEKKVDATLGEGSKLAAALREEGELALVLRDEKKLTQILQDENRLTELLAEAEKKDTGNDLLFKKKIPAVGLQSDAAEIERQILAFFEYLDERPYIQSYKFEGGTYLQYQIALKNLSSKLPIVTGEMASLYNMIRNVAHFYRTMGKKRVYATRQVLQNESEIMESVMKAFYQWFTMESSGPSALAGRPSPEVMYEYAGYLLNTLGGRSYLLRRNPKVRALTGFYCVLALDKANELELNSKGIDIRPYIKSSLMEVKNQIGLIFQKEYITKLNELNLKYYSY
jgi:hypothetical protein